MQTTLKEFESVWPRIRSEILQHGTKYNLPQDALDWFEKVGVETFSTISTGVFS